MDRLTRPSKASSILGKRVKVWNILQEQKSRFVGSRIKEHFELKLEERDKLAQKKKMLKQNIAQMVLDKQNFLKLSAKINRQKQEIQLRILELKSQLGDQLNFPLNPRTIRKIKNAGESLSKRRRQANAAAKIKWKEARQSTRQAILADPEYENESEAKLKQDTESNIYPSNLEFEKFFKTDFKVKLLRNFVSKNVFAFLDTESWLKVVDWASLRILGQVQVHTQKPVLDFVLESTLEDDFSGEANGAPQKTTKESEIFVFTAGEILRYKYKNETGQLSLHSKEKLAELKNTVQIEKHPLKGLVYLVQPEYVLVHCLASGQVQAKFLIGNGGCGWEK